jgi:hypothetical protein
MTVDTPSSDLERSRSYHGGIGRGQGVMALCLENHALGTPRPRPNRRARSTSARRGERPCPLHPARVRRMVREQEAMAARYSSSRIYALEIRLARDGHANPLPASEKSAVCLQQIGEQVNQTGLAPPPGGSICLAGLSPATCSSSARRKTHLLEETVPPWISLDGV